MGAQFGCTCVHVCRAGGVWGLFPRICPFVLVFVSFVCKGLSLLLGPGAFWVGWTVSLGLHHLASGLLEVFQKSVADFYFNSSFVEEHSWVSSHLLRLVSCLKHEFCVYDLCVPESTFLPCQSCSIDATSVVFIVVLVNYLHNDFLSACSAVNRVLKPALMSGHSVSWCFYVWTEFGLFRLKLPTESLCCGFFPGTSTTLWPRHAGLRQSWKWLDRGRWPEGRTCRIHCWVSEEESWDACRLFLFGNWWGGAAICMPLSFLSDKGQVPWLELKGGPPLRSSMYYMWHSLHSPFTPEMIKSNSSFMLFPVSEGKLSPSPDRPHENETVPPAPFLLLTLVLWGFLSRSRRKSCSWLKGSVHPTTCTQYRLGEAQEEWNISSDAIMSYSPFLPPPPSRKGTWLDYPFWLTTMFPLWRDCLSLSFDWPQRYLTANAKQCLPACVCLCLCLWTGGRVSSSELKG